MTTEQHFNCIFCKETFDNKEDLQIHFRKHGDPKFNQANKNKSRYQSESPNTSDKSTDENEMVGCDVCNEVFPTISKAITHKHKMHPEHDAKYFCPFCGKLFTMKHLYNKHIQANHDSQEGVEKSDFQCECCNVIFYVPSAMTYHNKFFHRQDTELPTIGQSKKVKLYAQELIQIYYCSFCGEEFNNKVNLHKHIGDDHSDENQSPSDVLKCPLCEALFYHLDAYEVHLMFHSSDDVYSEKNPMVDEITEFSLDTVPPIDEKIEDDISHNSTGIDDFLQMVMGQSMDNEGEDEGLSRTKPKKHKKHKKSKKAAITLDEFLNMNKDVFGDGIDVHGIEEVPTQVVLKKFKGKKQTNAKSKANNPDLDKLKKQGIVVKSKNKPITAKAFNMIQKKNCILNHDPKAITAPDDVLSKLIRQSSSQIKIVKKSVPQTENKQNISLSDEHSSELENSETNGQNKTNDVDNIPSDITYKNIINEHNDEEEFEDDEMNNDAINIKSVKEDNFSNPFEKSEGHGKVDQIYDIPKKSIDDSCDKNANVDKEVDNEAEEDASSGTMSALKRLSHLITVKPIKQNTIRNNPPEKDKSNEDIDSFDENSGQGQGSSYDGENNDKLLDNVFKAPEDIPKKNICRTNIRQVSKPTEIYKTSDDLVTKSVINIKKESTPECNEDMVKSNSSSKPHSSNNDDKVSQQISSVNNDLLSRLTNVTAKPISNKINTLKTNQSGNTKLQEVSQLTERKSAIDETIEIFNIDDSDSEDAADEGVNTWTSKDLEDKAQKSTNVKSVVHNFGKNITVKPCQTKPNIYEITNKMSQEESQLSKEANYTKVKMHSSEIQKSINLQNTLKNLGSNITVKTNNSSFINDKEDIQEESDHEYYDSEAEVDDGKIKITEVTDEGNEMEYESNDDYEPNVFVQSPEDPNLENEDKIYEDGYDDIESQIQSNTVVKSSQNNSPYLDNLRNCSKDVTIKPVNEKVTAEEPSTPPHKKEISNRSNISAKNIARQQNNETGVTNKNILNHKSSSTSNEVNTVKTVKKFQTQTVIQEVTTVTRTIRTVNESTNEIVQNTQSPSKPQIMNKNQTSKEYFGKVVKHNTAPTVGTKVINTANIANIRPSNQLIAFRPPPQIVRPTPPGPQAIRKAILPPSNTQKPIIGKLKISPHVMNQTVKRPSNAIPNNSFKKTKGVISETSNLKNDNGTMEYTNASTSQSNFSTTTKIIQGKSMTMTSQMRSEVTNMQQQLNKLSGMSGLKVMKTNTKQAMHFEEKCEITAPKSHTLEAIEKLQKIGLLVKKPRIDFNEENEHTAASGSDDDHYEQ